MFEYVVIGLLIVVIICLIYWICIRKSDEHLRAEYTEALNKSAGVLDVGARAALYALADIRNPTPADRFTHGRTIYHNVAGGDIGTFTREERRRLATQINDAMAGVLAGEDGMGVLGGVLGETQAQPRINTYMLTNMDMIRLGILAAGEIADDEILRAIAADLGNNLNTRGAEVRRANMQDVAAHAAATTTTRAAAVEKAFDMATQYTNDRQNVHDSAVNGDLRTIINRIDSAVVPEAALAEARVYVDGPYPGNADRKRYARSGIDTAAKRANVTALGMTEDRIFALVWDRAKHPLNEERADDMREAFINSLADGVENGHQVCVNGRVSRMLASMTLLDYDADVADGVLTLEAYRNAIFQQTKDIVDAAIDRAKASDDAAMRAVGDAYESGETVEGPASVTFNADLRRDIDDNLALFRTKMTPEELERVREECYIYASL